MKRKNNLPSFVYKNNKKYCVCQQVNGRKKYYGTYLDLDDAIQLRDKLVSEGVIKSRVGLHRLRGDTRYITHYDGRYCIYKNVDGRQEYFGSFKTLEEAMMERDYLESIDWDYSNME